MSPRSRASAATRGPFSCAPPKPRRNHGRAWRQSSGTFPLSQTRRALIASALALAATPALAADKKSVEVAKAFPYLENYWKLPAGERSKLHI